MSDPLTTPLAMLPHGPEFRFIDSLLELDPGQSGRARYTIPEPVDAPFLRGHFPQDPLMPGVLLIEAAAQLAGTVAQSDPTIPPLAHLKLTALRNIKIHGSAKPGEPIEIEANIVGRLHPMIQARVAVRCADRLLLQGELTLSGSP